MIRITCDNYLIQPDVIEGLAGATKTADADYGFIEPLSHYAGEVIRVEALREAWASGDYSDLAREHVTWDLRQSPATRKIALPKDYLGLDHSASVTLDTIEDLIQLKTLEAERPELEPVRCLDAVRQFAGSAS